MLCIYVILCMYLCYVLICFYLLLVFAPWKKSYDQTRQHIKGRDITLPTKVRLVKAMIFPVVMYGFECWTIKKAEHQRIDAFELWCWRKLLRVPLTARRSNQSILKEISPEYSIGRTDADVETPVLWLPDVNWFIGTNSLEIHWKRP